MPAFAVSLIPDAHKGAVFTAGDLDGVKPIRAVSGLPGFKPSDQPSLATDKVRHVGELVAMCVAPNRAPKPRTSPQRSMLDLEELPAVHDMLAARAPSSALVHEHWGDNVFLETFVDIGHRAGARRADQGHARDPHRAPMHGADGRPRRRGASGTAASIS